ncbi:MAG TPA: DEAD/DEAH box helicase, partial [Solirubrobacteraceae bacterium]|nr:DEAD/DEAH box helicase [Solirubrobacteraceae bacterium]
AERRAAALSLDRDLLRELLGQEELRDLIDPGALDAVHADLQHLSERTQAATRDALADVLRRLGDLTADEAGQRVIAGCDADAMLSQLERERRAIVVRIGGEARWIAADDAGLYRDALGIVPPGGLPEAFAGPVDDALTKLVARYARTHTPFTTEELRARYATGADVVELALRGLERSDDLVQGELRPGGSGREWCDTDVLRRLRRASLAVLRKEIEASEQQALATLLPSWQGIDRNSRSIGSDAAGVERLREVLVPLQGLALPVEVWERDVLPRRTGAYSPSWLDQLCASGEVVWAGAGPHHNSGRVALYFRDDALALGPPPSKVRSDAAAGTNAAVDTAEHELVRGRLLQSPCFFSDLLAELPLAPEQVQQALWDLVWAGEATNDAWAPLRAPRLSLARTAGPGRAAIGRSRRRSGTRFGARSAAGAQIQGRWSSTATIFGGVGAAGSIDPGDRRRAQAELLLERYGIVTREQVLAEGIPGGFAMLYDSFAALETLGVCRRGYFIEGLGGAQFALPGAVERLRAQRESTEAPPLVLAATDPAQPYGAVLPWPKAAGADGEGGKRSGGPRRVAGAHVVLVGAEPVLYAERGGKGLLTLVAAGDPRLHPAFEALAAFVLGDRRRKLALERIDGETVLGSHWEPLLVELGFRTSPRRMLLSA